MKYLLILSIFLNFGLFCTNFVDDDFSIEVFSRTRRNAPFDIAERLDLSIGKTKKVTLNFHNNQKRKIEVSIINQNNNEILYLNINDKGKIKYTTINSNIDSNNFSFFIIFNTKARNEMKKLKILQSSLKDSVKLQIKYTTENPFKEKIKEYILTPILNHKFESRKSTKIKKSTIMQKDDSSTEDDEFHSWLKTGKILRQNDSSNDYMIED